MTDKKSWPRLAWDFLCDLAVTIASGVLALLLYVLYIPFGVAHALFDRKTIRDFYGDVMAVLDNLELRMRKRRDKD